MPQFPDWKQPIAAVTDAAQARQSQVRQLASDLTAQGRETVGEVSARAVDYAERTRALCTQLPRTMADELRRRMNVLDLATRRDVEVQSRLGRSRVSVVLKEFLETQRQRDAQLLESLRAELREELQSFAAAIDDDLFEDDLTSVEPGASRRVRTDLDDLEDDLDDDDEIDLTDDELIIERALLDATDG